MVTPPPSWPGTMKLADFDPRTAKTVFEARERATPERMRLRLQEYAHHNPLVRAVFDSAKYGESQGQPTSTLDLMTELAFYALVDRERMESTILDHMASRPAPMLLTNCPECPRLQGVKRADKPAGNDG